MIIVAIVALSAVVLTALYAVLVGLPDFPSSVTSLIDQLNVYLTAGSRFLMSFVYGDVVLVLISTLLAAIGVYEAYKFVMWVVKKIPMFGVSD